MRRLVVLLCLALPLAACSFPEQGFMTRSMGGTVIDIVPETRPPVRSQVYTVPEPVGGEEPRRPDRCTLAARARADETKAQGFDDRMQQQVYDATFADCRKWISRE